MANDKFRSSLDDDAKDGGLAPATAPDAIDEVVNDERSLDIGESGQHAPGGYYNQQNVLAPDRLDLDEQTSKGLAGGSKDDK